MCVLDVKSTAWKPTRSIVGAMARTSGAGSPVALQSSADRRVVGVDDVDEPLMGPVARGRVARRTPRAPRSERTSTIVPPTPAGIGFIIFMTSIRQTTVWGSTRVPRST